MPGLKACTWPVRVRPPSGKMQTSSPLFRASRAVRRASDDLLRLERVDRNRAEQLRQPLDPRPLFDIRRPGDHADRPRAGEHQQDAIDPGDVIGHEQRPALARQVLAAEDAHAIDREAQQPDDEADRRLRDEQHDVEEDGNRSAAPASRKICCGEKQLGRARRGAVVTGIRSAANRNDARQMPLNVRKFDAARMRAARFAAGCDAANRLPAAR